VEARGAGEPVTLAALFVGLLKVSLCGIGGGGGIVWARRIAVENHRWISDREFADIVSLCQFMPGPNIVGIAVCLGARMRGAVGAIAALCGFLVVPGAVGFSFGVFFRSPDDPSQHPRRYRRGGRRAADRHRHQAADAISPPRGSLAFCRMAFALITFGRLPLLVGFLARTAMANRRRARSAAALTGTERGEA
jgi:Chromate transporter